MGRVQPTRRKRWLGERRRQRAGPREPSMVSDPLNGRLVVLGGAGDVLAFDATAREWTVLLEPSKVQPTPTP